MAQSQWLTQTLAAIALIAQGNASNTATQTAVATLTTRLATDEGNAAATDAEFQQAITALTTALAAAPAPTGTAPTVASISPSSGPIAGGTVVTVTGKGFTGATVVNFGAIAGTALNVASDTSITVTSPASAAGVVDVTVVTPSGISAVVAADQFTSS